MAVNSAPTFNYRGRGVVTTEFIGAQYPPVGSILGVVANSVAVQSDGKVIVGGTVYQQNENFALARYNPDGSLDTSFNSSGMLTSLLVRANLGINEIDKGQSVALQADGKILLAGSISHAIFDSSGSLLRFGYDLALTRYNSNGTLDKSFGNGGEVITPFAPQDESQVRNAFAQTVLSLADGSILVGGYVDNSDVFSGSNFILSRYNSNGSLDSSYGSSGRVTLGFDGRAYDMKYMPDGKVLMAGSNTFYNTQSQKFVTEFAMVRLNANGTLDSSFDSDGIVSGNFTKATSLTIQPDGKIVAIGNSFDVYGKIGLTVARYNPDGSLDSTFDGDGLVTTLLGGTQNLFGKSVQLQVDGKIVVAGFIGTTYEDLGGDFALVRFNTNGTLDDTFDNDGLVITNIITGGSDSNDFGRSLTLLADGKMLVAGSSSDIQGAFALARYNIDGTLDRSFGSFDSIDNRAFFQEDTLVTILDNTIQVYDPELGALNSGNGNYSGASITISRQGGANPEDYFMASEKFGTGNLELTTSTAVLGGITIGSASQSEGVLRIEFNSNATQARVNEALSSIGYRNSSNTPPPSVQIKWVFSDGNFFAQGSGFDKNTVGFTTVNITAVNDSPILTGSNINASYTKNSNAIVLDNALRVFDSELSSVNNNIGNYNGASFGLSRTTAANIEDVFSGTNNLIFNGSNAILSNVIVGSVQNESGILIITFNTNATQAVVNEVLSSITYKNTSLTPPKSVEISSTFVDGNTGEQGIFGRRFGERKFTVDIIDNDTPPNINFHVPDQSTVAATLFSYQLPENTFSLNNGRPLTYTATSSNGSPLPTWLTFDSITKTFSGTLPRWAAGNVYSIRVTATDPFITSAFDDFNITITPNYAPVVNLFILDTFATSGTFYSSSLPSYTITGVNGEEVSYSATLSDGSALPTWLTFNPATRTFSGTPTQVGVFDIRITGTDASLASSSDSFLLNVTASIVPLVLNGGRGKDVLVGNAGNDLISGAAGNDSLYGSDGNDRISGGNGSDFLDGGTGADVMIGGKGSDIYIVDHIGDFVSETSKSGGTDSVYSSVSFNLGANVENLVLTGSNNSNGIGNGLKNSIYGNSGSNYIDAGGGVDKLYGGAGHDTYVVDFIRKGSSASKRYVTLQDSINEGANEGNDTLIVRGQYVLSKATTLYLDGNLENLDTSGTGITKLNLIGNANSNKLTGNAADNSLDGGSHNDFLSGGLGNDTLTGGIGADTFVWSLADKGINANPYIDKVTDFNSFEDKLDLRDLLVGETSSTILNFLDITSSNTSGVINTEIRVSTNGGFIGGEFFAASQNQHITLSGVNLLSGTDEANLLASLITQNKLIIDI